jgi:hypothetical protein
MVQAMINISKDANQILNIVKARYNLKDKSAAIDKVILNYGEDLLEPELRPEYKVKLAKIVSGKHLSREDFEKEVA